MKFFLKKSTGRHFICLGIIIQHPFGVWILSLFVNNCLIGLADMDLDDLFEEPKTSSLGLKLSWTWTILVV